MKITLYWKDWQLQFEDDKQKATKLQEPVIADRTFITLKEASV